MDYIICHYSEIGLKGKNRKFFEEKLIENIKHTLPHDFFQFVKRISGRIIIKLTDKGEKAQIEIESTLKNVFGLAYFCFATETKQEIKSMQNMAIEIIKDKEFNSFRVSVKRSKKDFPLKSPEISRQIGGFLYERLNKAVDLTNPDLTVFIEIVEKYSFIYLKKYKGAGGLPVGTGGKAMCLLSGGIDSPVAAHSIIKRGAKLEFVHFHAYPYTNKSSIKKVEKLVKLLNKFQFHSILYLVPFAEIQKQIFLKTPSKLRVILYRRLMVRIAQEIANNKKILTLVTGENLGQVASQTMENISVIDHAIDLPVLRPLIGQDKEEIINKAKNIDTYEISILPDQDCCSRFLPKHPATKANLKEVEKAEKKLKIKKLVKDAIKNTEIQKII